MRAQTVLAAALAVFCVSSAFAAPAEEKRPFEGWTEARQTVLERVKRVGILPVRLPASLGDRPDVQEEIERLLVKNLSQTLEIVPSSEYTAILEKLSQDVGGVYDARTGKVDTAKHQALFEHAMRTFIETKGLQATLLPEIEPSAAKAIGGTAFLDHVIEPTTGKTSFWIKNAASGMGTVPGISFRLGLYDVNRKLLWAGQNGIQLTAYSGYNDFGGFRYVPVELLLRDKVRLQRAVDFTTLYIVESGEEITRDKAGEKERERLRDATARSADKIFPPLPEAPAPNASQPFKVPREGVLSRASMLVLEPIGMVNSRDMLPKYESLISKELTALGWKVAPTLRYMELYKAEMASASGTFDVHTGKPRMDVIESIRRNALAKLRKEYPVDATLRIEIVTTSAPQQGLRAEWDGVRQQATDLGPWTGERLVKDAKWGRIPALSLDVELKSLEGETLYKSRGGIQLLQYQEKDELVRIPARLFLTNEQHHEAAVHAAFHPLVTPPEVLAAEMSAAAGK